MSTRRRRRAYRGKWSDADRHVLDLGRNLLRLPGASFESLDDDLAREAWRDLGPALVADAIATTPGMRPRAWWKFTGIPKHGPRRRVDLDADLADLPMTSTAPPSSAPLDSIYESQEVYLRRNGELTYSELKTLAEWRAAK